MISSVSWAPGKLERRDLETLILHDLTGGNHKLAVFTATILANSLPLGKHPIASFARILNTAVQTNRWYMHPSLIRYPLYEPTGP